MVFGIGSYTVFKPREQAFLIIGNDTIQNDRDGLFRYKCIAETKGVISKRVEMQVYDRAGDPAHFEEAEYIFDVR